MSAPAKVKIKQANLYRPATPLYDIVVNGEIIGTVARTGTLRSCLRWWARFEGDALVGRENVRFLSKSTRKAAVDELLAHLTEETR